MKRSAKSSKPLRIQNSDTRLKMQVKSIIYIFTTVLCLLAFSQRSDAQFKEGAFTQNYNEPGDTTATGDSIAKLFSFKEFFGGLAHKNTIKVGTMAGTGGYYLHKYNKTKKVYDNFMSQKETFESSTGLEYPFNTPALDLKSKKTGTWLMVGAGLVYWGTLLDGVICYESDKNPDPGRATLYSALLPGLGQIYNGELFKVPIYWSCLLGSVYFLTTNHTNYVRFKRIHTEATDPDPAISSAVPISGETAKWYRDVYRRYRDYSIVATVAFYFLQVIDANVFAYMHDFEVDDNISMNIEPAVIAPDNAYAMHTAPNFRGQNAIGLRIGLTF